MLKLFILVMHPPHVVVRKIQPPCRALSEERQPALQHGDGLSPFPSIITTFAVDQSYLRHGFSLQHIVSTDIHHQKLLSMQVQLADGLVVKRE